MVERIVFPILRGLYFWYYTEKGLLYDEFLSSLFMDSFLVFEFLIYLEFILI